MHFIRCSILAFYRTIPQLLSIETDKTKRSMLEVQKNQFNERDLVNLANTPVVFKHELCNEFIRL